MVEVTVFLETEVNPTEDEDKVRTAVNNVLGNASINVKVSQTGSTLTAEAEGQDSLVKLRNMLRNDRVRDAARRLLFKSIRGNKISFFLNKQVAFAGHISFSEENAESPLGPIRFIIETNDPPQLIEWLAEKSGK
ncbi:MAG: RNA-binding domain-containing protein [Betaproteobacteria bacterium]